MNYVPNQNGKVLEETLAGPDSDAAKTTLRCLRCFKKTLPLLHVFQISPPFLCDFVTYSRQYYE